MTAPTSAEHRWYAIQTTSGHENKVRSLIQRRIDADPRPVEDRPIRQALVRLKQIGARFDKMSGAERAEFDTRMKGLLECPACVDNSGQCAS